MHLNSNPRTIGSNVCLNWCRWFDFRYLSTTLSVQLAYMEYIMRPGLQVSKYTWPVRIISAVISRHRLTHLCTVVYWIIIRCSAFYPCICIFSWMNAGVVITTASLFDYCIGRSYEWALPPYDSRIVSAARRQWYATPIGADYQGESCRFFFQQITITITDY